MMRGNKLWLAGGIVCLALGVWVAHVQSQQDNVQTMMQLKLGHAQKVLQGVVTEDYDLIRSNAQSLSLVSQAAAWQVLQTPEYQRYSADFRRTADDLARQAKDKDLDGAALSYVRLTITCVECHKRVRGVRVTQGDIAPEIPSDSRFADAGRLLDSGLRER